MIFYIYLIFNLQGVPCYLGKGKGKRYLDHRWSHNLRLRRLYAKHGELPAVVLQEGLSEDQALVYEVILIKAIGRRDLGTGPLYNLTDGGDGLTGWVPSELTRQRISKSNTGKTQSSETRRNMSLASRGVKKSPAHAKAISTALTGIKRSQATKDKMTEVNRRNAQVNSASLKSYFASLTQDQKIARGAAIRAGMLSVRISL